MLVSHLLSHLREDRYLGLQDGYLMVHCSVSRKFFDIDAHNWDLVIMKDEHYSEAKEPDLSRVGMTSKNR